MSRYARVSHLSLSTFLMWIAVLALLSTRSFAADIATHYHLLDPAFDISGTTVTSIQSSNVITAEGGSAATLAAGASHTFTTAQLGSGDGLSGTASFIAYGAANVAVSAVPDYFAGSSFVMPQQNGSHRYLVLPINADAMVTFTLDGTSITQNVPKGWVHEFDGGNRDDVAARITSSQPVLVYHIGENSNDNPQYRYIVPPASKTLWGIRTGSAWVAATENDTTVQVVASDGTSTSVSLNAGQQQQISIGGGGGQGQGSGVRLQSDKPIGAVQWNDGDGSAANALWASDHLRKHFILPTQTEYAAVTCPYANTQVTLTRPDTTTTTLSCNGSTSLPAKALFDGGAGWPAGTTVVATKPVYVVAEDDASEQEVARPGYNISQEINLTSNITTDTLFEHGNTYRLKANIIVSSGITLTVESGATIVADGNYLMTINGNFSIRGTAAQPAKFTSNKTTPPTGGSYHWQGIQVNSTGSLTADYVDIEHAQYGIHFNQAGGTVTNANIHHNANGIRIVGNSSPTVRYSTFDTHHQGIQVIGGNSYSAAPAPVFEYNTIKNSVNWGVVVTGANNTTTALKDPQPRFNYNTFQNSNNATATQYGYQAGRQLLDFRFNNWNSTSIDTIASKISDYNESATGGVVNFANYLDTTTGQPVNGNMVMGELAQNTTWLSNTTYTQIGKINIPAGVTLSIPSGVIFTAPSSSFVMLVSGTLNVSGGVSAPVKFTSGKATPPTSSNYHWQGLQINAGGVINADYVDIEHAQYGIHFNEANGAITNSSFHHNSHGLYIVGNSSPTVRYSTINQNYIGTYITSTAASAGAPQPVFEYSSISSNALYGIYLYGPNITTSAAKDPQPRFNYNTISNGSALNVSTTRYAYRPGRMLIDARYNWWNATDIHAIASKITDYTDATSSPVINFAQYLDTANGNAVSGNMVAGELWENTVWTAGATYTLIGKVTVANGTTLTVGAGARVFAPSTTFKLDINGSVNAIGSTSSPVVFTSGKSTPPTSLNFHWLGLQVNAGGTLTADYVDIEHAQNGVYFNDASGSIAHANIHNNANGLNISGSSTPTIRYSTIEQNYYGVYVTGLLYATAAPTPIFEYNIIKNNSQYGAYLYGTNSTTSAAKDPAPRFNYNDIYGNLSRNIYSTRYSFQPDAFIVNMKHNWWGSTDPGNIANTITDYTDSTVSPVVNFSGFLDSQGGNPVPGEMVTGSIATSTTWQPGSEYVLVGNLTIKNGATLTIPAGVEVNVPGSFKLIVDGNLTVEGTAENPVGFYNKAAYDAGSSSYTWSGIQVNTGGQANINYAYILNAQIGIQFYQGGGTLDEVSVAKCSTGIEVFGNASPVITNSYIYLNTNGIRVSSSAVASAAPTPTITHNVIYANTNGLYLEGSQITTSSSKDPRPIVQYNAFIDNTTWNVFSTNYKFQPKLVVIDSRYNWWGTTDAGSIDGKIHSYSSAMPAVDYRQYLDGIEGDPVAGHMVLGTIATNETWGVGDHLIIGEVDVASTATLTVEPGAIVRAASNVPLNVSGRLLAQGSAETPIVFTSNKQTVSGGHNWKGVGFSEGSLPSVLDYVEISHAEKGISVTNSASHQLTHLYLHDNATGAYLLGSSPVSLTDSTIQHNSYGIEIRGQYGKDYSTPANILRNQIANNSTYGIYLVGTDASTTNQYDPRPVIQRNGLFANTWNVYTYQYRFDYANVRIDASENYWGSADPGDIANLIYDYSDSTSRPVVDFSRYLDDENGTPQPTTLVTGKLGSASGTTWSVGTTYIVGGNVSIPSGNRLTIGAGTQVLVPGNFKLSVEGTLNIEGTASLPVHFYADAANVGEWGGVIASGSSAALNISHAIFENATYAVQVEKGASLALSNSELKNNTYGFRVSGTDAVTIINNSIQRNTIGGFYEASTTNFTGGQLTNNVISDNTSYGLWIKGLGTSSVTYLPYMPKPVIQHNRFERNNSHNIWVQEFTNDSDRLVLDARYNYWGTTDPAAIADKINGEQSFGTTGTQPRYPFLDYRFFKDAAGNVVPGNMAIGPVDSPVTWGPDTDITMIGPVWVTGSGSLTIESGTTITVPGDFKLAVSGALIVNGSAENPVIFRSDEIATGSPQSLWSGITGFAQSIVDIDYAVIQQASYGVQLYSTNGSITNSTLQYNNYALYLYNSSPLVENNVIQYNSYGIYIYGQSTAQISGNVISDNSLYGLYLMGAAGQYPLPVVNGNDIVGNLRAVYFDDYVNASGITLDFSDNWWGTPNPNFTTLITSDNANTFSDITLDTSSPKTAAQKTSLSAKLISSLSYLSPNNDGIQDASSITASLTQSQPWTLTVRKGGSAIRTYSGSGAAVSAVWDGRNAAQNVVTDGVYELILNAGSPSTVLSSQQIVIDSTIPNAAILSPATGSTLYHALATPVTGTAADTNLLTYQLAYRPLAGSVWTNFATGSQSVMLSTLTQWNLGGNTTAPPANGSYELQLAVSDKAGNKQSVSVLVELQLITLLNVQVGTNIVNPHQGQTLTVDFDLLQPASVVLQIRNEKTDIVVREVTANYSAAGNYELTWDGRDYNGDIVADDAYKYALLASSGSSTGRFDPEPPPAVMPTTKTDAAFNATRNDFWQTLLTLTQASRIKLTATNMVTGASDTVYDWTAYPAGEHLIFWDGHMSDGSLGIGLVQVVAQAVPIAPNAVIIQGSKPVIKGIGPDVIIKATPYVAYHSYEQVAHIDFEVTHDSTVTVVLERREMIGEVSEFDEQQLKWVKVPQYSTFTHTLMNNAVLSAMDGGAPKTHEIEWHGYDESDTNNILTAQEGTFTFVITATSVTTGFTTTYRGVLQLYK